MGKTLKQRIEDLEYVTYRKWIKKCPRCGQMSMNERQKGICFSCAYKKGDKL